MKNQDEQTQPLWHSDYINFFIYDPRQRNNKKHHSLLLSIQSWNINKQNATPSNNQNQKNYNSPHMEQLAQKFAHFKNESDDTLIKVEHTMEEKLKRSQSTQVTYKNL